MWLFGCYNSLYIQRSLEFHVKIANAVYILVALIQLNDPLFFDFLVSGRTGVGRGVNSLTVEPSMFALTSLVFALLSMRFAERKSRAIWISINFFAIIILAKSALGILLIFAILGVHYVRFNVKALLSLVGIIFLIYLILQLEFWQGTRVAKLLGLFAQKGLIQLIFLDSSISGRVSHIICSNIYSLMNFGLPNGYNAFVEAYSICNENLFQNNINRGANPKIMSMIGSTLFELGPIVCVTVVVILLKGKLKNLGHIRDFLNSH